MKLTRLILSVTTAVACCVVGVGVPAHAQPKTSDVPPRFSVRAIASASLFAPYIGASLGYRLPALDNRMDLFATLIPEFGSVGALPIGYGLVGARYYWGDKASSWQPFGVVSAGFSMSGASSPSPGGGTPQPASLGFPIFNAGLGADYMFTRNVGLTGSLSLSLPYFLWPELGVKIAF